MANIIIALLIAVIIILSLLKVNFYNEETRTILYKRWYLPWAAVLYSVLMYLVFHFANMPELPLFNMLPELCQAEAVYSLLCIAIWEIMLRILKSPRCHESLIGFYRRFFVPNNEDKETALPFPYYIDHYGIVKARVGQVFYRWTLKAVIFFVALIYVVMFILPMFFSFDLSFFSAFGILGLLPLVEYYVYLCAEVPVEKETEITITSQDSDFDQLWQIYVNTFDNYSVAWKRENDEIGNENVKNWRADNDNTVSKLMNEFSHNKKSVFLENSDLVTAFIRIEPFIDFIEKQGQHVLIALDIPNHFTKNQEKSFTQEIADELETILKKNFNVYDEKSTEEDLRENVVMAPLSLISSQGLKYEWMSKIGLIVVVNIYDKGISNLYENRRFCYLLKSVNQKFQLLFVTPHRKGTEPALKHTWLTQSQTIERKLRQFPYAGKQFFIAYNYEEYTQRLGRILKSIPNEPLYSGSEMSMIALSVKYGKIKKVVTPIHYLDLAYTYSIEGPEEVSKFVDYLDEDYFEMRSVDIDNEFKNHLLLVEQVVEDKILTVIFDQENNAPVVYRKWLHLGFFENFSIVISKPYLFRDYFNANHDHFVATPFESLEPRLCKSKITLAIILLNMLKNAKNGMEEKELKNLLTGYYDEDKIKSVPTIIKTLFANYFSSDLANMLKTSQSTKFNGVEYQHLTTYELRIEDDVDLSYLDTITVVDESNNVLFEILYDLMYQNYCKGQMHPFSGKPYIIDDYNKKTKTLKVRPKNNNDKEIIFYKPCLRVLLSGEMDPIKDMEKTTKRWKHRITGQDLSLSIEGYETNITIETEKIYEFTSYHIGSGFNNDNCPPVRNYKRGKFLKVSFEYLQKPEYLERENDIRKSLQILIYEMLQSLFPHHAQYLIVASEGEGDCENLPWIFNHFHVEPSSEDDNTQKRTMAFYFIEDAHIDLGLIGALADEDNIMYMFRYIYDYLIWLSEGVIMEPDGYKTYLNRERMDKFSFLKYGKDELLRYIDINLLINFIRDFFMNGDEWDKVNLVREFGACDFCGKEMRNSEMTRLEDGRMRCPDCGVGAIDTKDQFNAICEQAKELFKTHLNIDFNTIPYIATLTSAVELHRIRGYSFHTTNRYDRRKILGMARGTQPGEFFVENGYKAIETLGTVVHEMTHIWEYENQDFMKVAHTNGDWVEGLAVWTDLYLSEKAGATDTIEQRASWLARTDEYGRGLQLIMDTCPDDPYQYIRNEAKKL